MASVRIVFAGMLLLFFSVAVFGEEDISQTKDLFEGVWMESYPGQSYDVTSVYYFIIWRIDDKYISIGATTRWPAAASVLSPGEGPLADRQLNGGDVVYELDENNKDILYRSVKEGVNIIEGPEVVRYRRFTSLDLDQLEAFLSKMPKLP